MKETKKIKYNRFSIPKCPNCGKELGKDIGGEVLPYSFLQSCSCGQKLEWREKKQKCRNHFVWISDGFSNRQSLVFLKG